MISYQSKHKVHSNQEEFTQTDKEMWDFLYYALFIFSLDNLSQVCYLFILGHYIKLMILL